ncbi:replication protein A [Yersinia ruckeri]|uniref:replication endonuclease n=1 Tax=Yersinia ruckeri TaxID=29486 RepID=UPI0008FE2DF6|nr:replication endonuclease [Yersinia ruckeri]OJB82965.1 replication protein A [Yersinia ruckeri]
MTAAIQRPVSDFTDGDILSLSLPFHGDYSTEPEPSRVPKDIGITERELWAQNPTDHQWRSQYLGEMPQFLARYFGDRYSRLYETKGRRHANTFLRTAVGENVLPRLQRVNCQYQPVIKTPGFLPWPFSEDLERLPSFGRDELRNLSHRVADFMSESFADYIERNFTDQSSDPKELWKRTQRAYIYLVKLSKQVGTEPPYWREFTSSRKKINPRKIESGLLRMMAVDWWRARLKRLRDLRREHMAIAVGQVQRAASAYVSRSTMAEWVEQKRRNREFFKAFELENEATGERVSLEKMVNGSNTNPAIRRCELMVRMRGFEDLANEMGCVGEFYTITAPSAYHAVHSGGGFVSQWNGASPRQTQKYLCSVWAKSRAALARAGISVFGFRVVEPHHDGTPHWHVLLFMLPQHVEQARDILCYYARFEDSEKLQSPEALKARFHVESIDPSKGSATGYIAKYISKNIDGYGLDGEEDGETGAEAREMAKAVTAWASRWRIRQFQQIGGAPVTVWRELRRIESGTELPSKAMDAVLEAADTGDWAAYTKAQGGALVVRRELRVRLTYQITEMGNIYAEDVQRIQGVYSPFLGSESLVCTRVVKWNIVPKLAESAAQAGVSGGDAAPWSSVHNCTPDARLRLSEELRSRGFKGDEFELTTLERGSSLKIYGDRSIRLEKGRLVEVTPQPANQRWPGWN